MIDLQRAPRIPADTFAMPCSPIAESAVLGSVIADPTLACDLRSDWFYDERNKAVCDAITELSVNGKPIDETTVRIAVPKHLNQTVTRAVEACFSSANFALWRDILEQKHRLRRHYLFHVDARERIQALPSSSSVDEDRMLMDELESQFVDLGRDSTGALEEHGMPEVIDELFDELEKGCDAIYLKTGLQSLDRTLMLRKGQLVVVAARPGVGKTALAGRLVEHVAIEQQIPVGWISLEMSRTEIMKRMASNLSGVPLLDFALPDERQALRIVDALGKLKAAPIRVCDKGGVTYAQIAGLARRWKVRNKIQLLVVDYLGLINSTDSRKSRTESISEITAHLKQLARDLDITILLLCQLNRQSVGNEHDEKPKLHHLRDSGSIEQDADSVVLLQLTGYDAGLSSVSAFVEKQRGGPLGECKLSFHGATTRFNSVSPVTSADIPRNQNYSNN